MNTPMLSQVLAGAVIAPAGHPGATPYVLAFLSSTAIEVVAVAGLLSMLAFGVAHHVSRSTATGEARPWASLDPLKLYKIIIPLACLSMTAWIWLTTQGA